MSARIILDSGIKVNLSENMSTISGMQPLEKEKEMDSMSYFLTSCILQQFHELVQILLRPWIQMQKPYINEFMLKSDPPSKSS